MESTKCNKYSLNRGLWCINVMDSRRCMQESRFLGGGAFALKRLERKHRKHIKDPSVPLLKSETDKALKWNKQKIEQAKRQSEKLRKSLSLLSQVMKRSNAIMNPLVISTHCFSPIGVRNCQKDLALSRTSSGFFGNTSKPTPITNYSLYSTMYIRKPPERNPCHAKLQDNTEIEAKVRPYSPVEDFAAFPSLGLTTKKMQKSREITIARKARSSLNVTIKSNKVSINIPKTQYEDIY